MHKISQILSLLFNAIILLFNAIILLFNAIILLFKAIIVLLRSQDLKLKSKKIHTTTIHIQNLYLYSERNQDHSFYPYNKAFCTKYVYTCLLYIC